MIRKISAKRMAKMKRMPFSTIRRKKCKVAAQKVGRPAPGEHGGPLLRGKARSERRAQIFERAGGRCEEIQGTEPFLGMVYNLRCPNPATEWSHARHGPMKCDCYSPTAQGACSIASCRECHRKKHGQY